MQITARRLVTLACSSFFVLLGAGCAGNSDDPSAESLVSAAGPSASNEDAGTRDANASDTKPHDVGAVDGGKDAPPESGTTTADSSPPPPPPPPPPPDAGSTVDTGTVAVDSAPPPPAIDSAPTPADAPTVGSARLVGYYATWTRSTMPPSTIPWDRLTHIAHAFVLPSSGGGLSGVSSYVDAELISTAHAHGVKVVASVGGAGANFDANVDATVRAKTVSDLASLCGTYGYDGIDIDWEFPTTATAPAWNSLITELRTALDAVRPGLTISAAVASGPFYGDALPSSGLSALSWIGVMTYDYAGSWSTTSGHESPLYPSPGGDGGSVSESVDYFVGTRGMSADRVLIGLPFYGAGFGATAIASKPIAPATNPDYRDIVPMIGTGGWMSAWDDTAKVPYLHRGASPGFLSYDDATSIGQKCAYGKSRALGGAIIWHLAGDRLSDGTNPLLEAAQPCR